MAMIINRHDAVLDAAIVRLLKARFVKAWRDLGDELVGPLDAPGRLCPACKMEKKLSAFPYVSRPWRTWDVYVCFCLYATILRSRAGV